jgi:hypothetical protein
MVHALYKVLAILARPISYYDVPIQSNPFNLKETECTVGDAR